MRYSKRRVPELVTDRRIRLNREYMVLSRKYERLSTAVELTPNKAPIQRQLKTVRGRLGVLRTMLHRG